MPDQVRLRPSDVISEVDCHREEVLDMDPVFRSDAGIPVDDPRSGWTCTDSMFMLEDNYALNEELETEIAFLTYNIGDDDMCELVDMEVAEAYRGQGLARRLIDEALADIRLKGGTRLYLFAYEPEDGSRTEFFSRFGFRTLVVEDKERSASSLPFPMRLDLE
jgi:GNAT superfamily N-acetyltransferase